VPAYFSIDGGNTNLANFDVTFDSTLFLNVPDDPLTAHGSSGANTALTPLDLELLGVLGFDVTSTPTLPTPGTSPRHPRRLVRRQR
jgi:serralysin